MSADSATRVPKRREVVLPDKLIVGYANWNQCDDLLVEAVTQGVNVLIWFSINLSVNSITGEPMITNGPDRECVISKINTICAMNLPTIHLISIGGWNSPHPDIINPVEDTYANWVKWNDGLFDGFDWDIEGNDDTSSVYNHFTYKTLDIMGRFSQLAKQDGYIVAMAPAESYLDPNTSVFDLDLTHTYPEWNTLQPDFAYHGHNVYAYLLLKYAETILTRTDKDSSITPAVEVKVNTFDFVTVQLYEGYSHAEYNISVLKQSPSNYLQSFAKQMYTGWDIHMPNNYPDCVDDPTAGSTQNNKQTATSITTASSTNNSFSVQTWKMVTVPMRMSVDKMRLVIGLANGWAGDGKFLLIRPEEVGIAYSALAVEGLAPRGFAFWNIKDEGLIPPISSSSAGNVTSNGDSSVTAAVVSSSCNDDVKTSGSSNGDGESSKDSSDDKSTCVISSSTVTAPVWMAAGLNNILHIRNINDSLS